MGMNGKMKTFVVELRLVLIARYSNRGSNVVIVIVIGNGNKEWE